MTGSTDADKTTPRSGWAVLGSFLAKVADCVVDAFDEVNQRNDADEHDWQVDGWKEGPDGYGYYLNGSRLYRD
ncbi:hypothetical protein [Salinisphaera orenii]|uniref:hypothetical protein n=1 Tax=Salinisphaera orenii TaxID=856731 RepID=UPI000DBEA8A7